VSARWPRAFGIAWLELSYPSMRRLPLSILVLGALLCGPAAAVDRTELDLTSLASRNEDYALRADYPLAHGRGQMVMGVGSASPVMRTAPNVDPSRRILSDGCVPNTWP